MAMTAGVKDELSHLNTNKACCRKAEVAALLRFGGALHLVSGKLVVEAELDHAMAARRLKKDLSEVFGHNAELAVIQPSGIRKGARYVVRISEGGERLAIQVGLVDAHKRPIRGLPPAVVSGGVCDAEAAWRGAFLAHGSLTEPGRAGSLEITCPGPEDSSTTKLKLPSRSRLAMTVLPDTAPTTPPPSTETPPFPGGV